MSAAWFVDGEYLSKIWQNLGRADNLDYVKLRQHLELSTNDFQVSHIMAGADRCQSRR